MKAIGVISVKGGTGKTLISVNLAHFLKQITKKSVGIIDADIDSSNFAEFVKVNNHIDIDDATKQFNLFDWDGIKVWSMSLLAEKWRPVSMTADKYVQILNDAVNYSNWGNTDYMVVDLPSGAMDSFRGAVYIFAEQLVGNVIVVQPAFEDNIRRVLNLHKVNEIPVIGVVENMAYFVCPYHKQPKVFNIFGKSKVEEIVKEYGYTYLGKIPIVADLHEKIEKNNNPILDEYAEPFEKAVDIIVNTPEEKIGIVKKLTAPIKSFGKKTIDKIIAFAVKTMYSEISLPNIPYDERAVLDLVIVNDTREKVITRWHLMIKEGKLRIVKNPKKVDFEIETTFKTLARIFLGKKRARDGNIIPYDIVDSWFNLDLEIYGTSATPRAIRLIRKIFGNKALSKVMTEKFGFLERYI